MKIIAIAISAFAFASAAFAQAPTVTTKTAPAPFNKTFSNGVSIAPSSTTITSGTQGTRGYSSSTSNGATVTIPFSAFEKKKN